jgi:hypothetical protein
MAQAVQLTAEAPLLLIV